MDLLLVACAADPRCCAPLETAAWSTDAMSLGLTLSVLCAEDVGVAFAFAFWNRHGWRNGKVCREA